MTTPGNQFGVRVHKINLERIQRRNAARRRQAFVDAARAAAADAADFTGVRFEVVPKPRSGEARSG